MLLIKYHALLELIMSTKLASHVQKGVLYVTLLIASPHAIHLAWIAL